jgi:hypothetical protein
MGNKFIDYQNFRNTIESMEKATTQLLLRIPVDLKAALQKEADFQGRKLTQEINIRLRTTLGAHGPTLQGILSREAEKKGVISNPLPTSYTEVSAPPLKLNDKGPATALSDADQAMLEVFRKMPVDKQLALLSLFK